MMNPRIFKFLAHTSCVLLLALGMTSSVHAAKAGNGLSDLVTPNNGASHFAPAPGVSMQEATDVARAHTGGRVLSTTPKKFTAGMGYKVRVLLEGGRVVTVTVDPAGRIKGKR